MMPPGKLGRLVGRNALRSPRHLVLSAFGIVVGIASFVFFLGLSLGVKQVILGELFPLDQVEVVAPRASFLGKDFRKKLDDAVVEQIRAQPGVTQAIPRMGMAFPATGQAWFEGHSINFELGGFADGIPAEMVADEDFAALFRDWEAPGAAGALARCGPAPEYTCPEPGRYYCEPSDGMCHHRVPVIVSPTLLELYNGQFAASHGLPVIGQFEQFVVERGGLGKMRFYIGLGDTMVAGSNIVVPAHEQRQVQGMLLGVSTRAMPIGMTVPIEYMRRWNRQFAGEEAASSYSSIVVKVADKDAVAPFSAWLQQTLDLRVADSMGERFATAIFIVTSLFVLISFVIVGISAINIAHNFFMQVSERRREIGILRAVGATRGDVRLMVLGEAALIGVLGGALGIFLAVAAAAGVDAASAAWLPAFPFKPETYFAFPPAVLASGLGFSILFCVLGGFLPARRAAAEEPARALVQQ
jgi:putative ABC transport system permease protein